MLLRRIFKTPKPSLTVKYILKLLFSPKINLPFQQRINILKRFEHINQNIICAHTFDELLIPTYKILSSKTDGCIVEAGAYKGGGTSKLSIIAHLTGRKLYVFDSFMGLPDNDEPIAHTTMGYSHEFVSGEYCGQLEEVIGNVKKYGEINSCVFIKGLFSETMPKFKEKILLIYGDVDLVLSNKDCLTYLYPLTKGGFFFSQDVHIPKVKELFETSYKVYHYTKRLGEIR
jgi:O-methyltransferase